MFSAAWTSAAWISAAWISADLVGSGAAVLTTTAFLPQAIRTLRTRDTVSLSLWTWVMLVTGVLLWLVYGLWIGSPPIICANAVTAVFAGLVLAVKVANVASGRDRHLPGSAPEGL